MTIKNLMIAVISTLLWITPALPVRGGNNLSPKHRLAQQVADKELDQFLQAKEAVFERDWSKARDQLEKFINDFPTGRLRDEALYWLARSLNGCAAKESSRSSALAIKKEAFSTLDRLVREYTASAWKKDAEQLKIEIASELVLLGASEYEGFIRDYATSQKEDEMTLKFTALNSLIRLEPQVAFTVLASVLETEVDSRVRRRSATLLGQFYSQEALAVLENAAQSDPDSGIREEAAYWVEQIRIKRIPSDLSYYAVAARVTGDAARSRLKENILNSYMIQQNEKGLAETRKIISAFFDGQVGGYESWAVDRLVANKYILRSGETSHKLHDFRISIVPGSVRKSPSQVAGEVLFSDLVSGEHLSKTFSVDAENDQIFAARRGDRAAFFFLHFETVASDLTAGSEKKEEDSLTGILKLFSKLFGRRSGKKPAYYNLYTNFMGCRIHSQTAAVETKNITDFGLAKAEIPTKEGSHGVWTLTGHITAFTKTRTFVARNASLADSRGKIVAVGDEITIGVDDPARFQVRGSRMENK